MLGIANIESAKQNSVCVEVSCCMGAPGRVHACMLVQRLQCTFSPSPLLHRLRNSRYVTTNGDEADYYFIPSKGWMSDLEDTFRLMKAVARKWPWWNRTVAAGEVRRCAGTA